MTKIDNFRGQPQKGGQYKNEEDHKNCMTQSYVAACVPFLALNVFEFSQIIHCLRQFLHYQYCSHL